MILRKLLGLPHLLVFSALTGISFSFAFRAGGQPSEAGFGYAAFDFLSRFTDPNLQAMIVVVSLIFSVLFIFRLSKFFREVYEHKLVGIGTAALGFSGSFLVILAPQDNSHLLTLGIGTWIIGIVIVIFYRKNQLNKRT